MRGFRKVMSVAAVLGGFLATEAQARLTLRNSTRDQRISGRQVASDTRYHARQMDILATQKFLDAARTADPRIAQELRDQGAALRLQASELRRSANSVDSSSFKDVAIPLLAVGGIVGGAVAIGASGSSSSDAPSSTPVVKPAPVASTSSTYIAPPTVYVPPAAPKTPVAASTPSSTSAALAAYSMEAQVQTSEQIRAYMQRRR